MDLLLGPGVSHSLTPINQHHPTQSQSSLLSNHSVIWGTKREEGWWETIHLRQENQTHAKACCWVRVFPPPSFSPLPTLILEPLIALHTVKFTHKNDGNYLEWGLPDILEDSPGPRDCSQSNYTTSSLPAVPHIVYTLVTLAKLGLEYFISFQIKNGPTTESSMESPAQPRCLAQPYPQMPL